MKITLAHIRQMRDIFTEIPQPETVYHMTHRSNLPAILKDGKIKNMDSPGGGGADFMTWFFPSLDNIPVYIELTGADTGRKYYGNDGQIHMAPPLNHAETIVLKLRPRGSQPMEWYTETKRGRDLSGNAPEKTAKLLEYMNNCRVCHFGPMAFNPDPEVIELTEVDKMPEPDALKDIRRLKGGR